MRLGEGCVLQGERIALRDLTPADAGEEYARWMNDPEVNGFLESRFDAHTVESITEYVRYQNAAPDALLLAIVVRDEVRHIGNIKLGALNGRHSSADIGLMIGAREYWNRGYATEAIRLLAAHAFGALGLHKLVAGFYAANKGSMAAFRKAGFSDEGVQKEQFALNGQRMDCALMGQTAPEWRNRDK